MTDRTPDLTPEYRERFSTWHVEVSNELLGLLRRARESYEAMHGKTLDFDRDGGFDCIESSALTLTMVQTIVQLYKREHGRKPPLETMVRACGNLLPQMIDDVNRLYEADVQTMVTDSDELERLLPRKRKGKGKGPEHE